MKNETAERIHNCMLEMDFPEWITKAGKTYLKILYQGVLEETGEAKITISDTIEYFRKYVGIYGFNSSFRFLGTISGDWRPINNLAETVLAYFKYVNPEELRREAKRAGLEPKF